MLLHFVPGSNAWRQSARDRYESSKATGECCHITTHAVMAEYLEKTKGKKISAGGWRPITKWSCSKAIFYIYRHRIRWRSVG